MPAHSNAPKFKAAIFDMDGVITDTAELHFLSWKEIFDEFLKKNPDIIEFEPFSKNDYLKYVDGIMRDDGIKTFLKSRNLWPLDKSDQIKLIKLIGDEKDHYFLKKIEEQGAKIFLSSINLVHLLHRLGKKVAVISSSRYCKDILKKADVYKLFDAIVDGKILGEKHIPGKPHPGIFLEAAKILDSPPESCLWFF